jgi:hypothetical protein
MTEQIDEESPLTGQIDLASKARHRRIVIKKKIDQAERGDELSGKAVLQAAAAAIYLVTEKKPIDDGDIEALRFVHKAFLLYLNERVQLEKALGIANEVRGRPKKVDISIFLALAMDRELDAQLKRGEEKVIKRAKKRVSVEHEASLSTVEKAWEAHGGEKGHEMRKALLEHN